MLMLFYYVPLQLDSIGCSSQFNNTHLMHFTSNPSPIIKQLGGTSQFDNAHLLLFTSNFSAINQTKLDGLDNLRLLISCCLLSIAPIPSMRQRWTDETK